MTYATTVQRISNRLLLCLAPRDKSLLIFLRDRTQAYSQSENFIQSNIFVEPPILLNLGSNNLLCVVKPLYGLLECGLYWFETYYRHHADNGKMKRAVHDMSFLFRKEFLFGNSKICGAICLQTDDTLGLGTAAFLKIDEEQDQKLAKKKTIQVFLDESTIFFNGSSIQLSNGILSIEQEFHNLQLTALNNTAPIDKPAFVSQRTRGAYIVPLSRPNLSEFLHKDASFPEKLGSPITSELSQSSRKQTRKRKRATL